MKKTNEVFENPSLEREEENVSFGAFRVQPTQVGRNIGVNQFGFEVPVTHANPQLGYSNLPVNVPVVNQQQPYFGYGHPAFQPVNVGAGMLGSNPATGYAFPNPYLSNQIGYQQGFGATNVPVVPVGLNPVHIAGVPLQQPFYANVHTQQPGYLYNPALGALSLSSQEQLNNPALGMTGLQNQPIPMSYSNASGNGKKDFISWIPESNILETDKFFRIEMAVPGITRETCKVGIDKGILWVSGTRKIDESESKLVSITKKEFSYGSFYRSFLLTENLENEKIQVSCHHGLLTINIPKRELTKKIASEIAVN